MASPRLEWLLQLLENDALVGPNGVERANLGITVIGATTDVARVPDTLLSRFGSPIVLTRFRPGEAMAYANQTAARIFDAATDEYPSVDELLAIIYAGNFDQRRIRSILDAFRDTYYEATGRDLRRALDRMHLTTDGLDGVRERLKFLPECTLAEKIAVLEAIHQGHASSTGEAMRLLGYLQ